jgi:phosphatidylglycerophosphate synthase
MVATRYKQLVDDAVRPLAAWLGRAGVSPTALTLAGPILTLLACLWLLRARAIVPFCGVIVAIGLLDGLDGAVARATGRVSKTGAYLDALCDRYVEALVVLSVAAVTGYWLLSTVALVGALVVSYAKARAAMEVPVSNLEWPDLMERAERDLLFIIGLAAGALLPWRPLGHDLFWWTLLAGSILVHLTVLQRARRALRFIRQRSSL